MTREPTTPCAWANLLSTAWGPRFPVDVRLIALEYSKRFADPIHMIAEAEVAKFEGALYPLTKKGGWAILYNPSISSKGRINYTIGHEFGHYLVHRALNPAGFECGQGNLMGTSRSAQRKEIEQEADRFASYLLMPLTDFRAQIGRNPMSLELLRHCVERYQVSYTAAALKWLESTTLCAAVVVATNGFVSWCFRSKAAQRARIFFPFGMELPAGSIAGGGCSPIADASGATLPPGVWSADRGVREMTIAADHYEMTISLLVFEGDDAMRGEWQDEEVEDSFDRIASNSR